jgi:hypothetical protein
LFNIQAFRGKSCYQHTRMHDLRTPGGKPDYGIRQYSGDGHGWRGAALPVVVMGPGDVD